MLDRRCGFHMECQVDSGSEARVGKQLDMDAREGRRLHRYQSAHVRPCLSEQAGECDVSCVGLSGGQEIVSVRLRVGNGAKQQEGSGRTQAHVERRLMCWRECRASGDELTGSVSEGLEREGRPDGCCSNAEVRLVCVVCAGIDP